MIRWYSIIFLILNLSCAPKSKIIRQSSIFSQVNLLGVNKAEFISKFGKPFNTDIQQLGEKTVESYYYVEIVEGIAVTTRFIFEEDILVKQENHNINFESQEIKRLKKEVKRMRFNNNIYK